MGDAAFFGLRLKELREAAGLTQQQLAGASGVGFGGIRDIERGVRSPSWKTVLALADALKVKTEAFRVEPGSRVVSGRGRPRKKEKAPPPKGKKRT